MGDYDRPTNKMDGQTDQQTDMMCHRGHTLQKIFNPTHIFFNFYRFFYEEDRNIKHFQGILLEIPPIYSVYDAIYWNDAESRGLFAGYTSKREQLNASVRQKIMAG